MREFFKMHGAGNDFVLLDGRSKPLQLTAEAARALADRHTGIGCDQVLVLHPADDPGLAARVEIWNADGSKAEQCGNGMRCIGTYLAEAEPTPEELRVESPAGVVRMAVQADGQVRVAMGQPRFEPDSIPTRLQPEEDGWYRLNIAGNEVRLGLVSMGNPHAVVAVSDVDSAPVAEWGPAIGQHEAFPNGCNVGFAAVQDLQNMRLRVYERGTGETLACGSGACAAASWLARCGELGRSASVHQAGGSLMIETSVGKEPIWMTGPAARVFKGDLTWGKLS